MLTATLYRIAGRFVKVERLGLLPEGERTNFHYRGDVEGDEIAGKLSGIDYSVTDAVGTVEVRIIEVLTTAADEKIFIERSGRSLPVDDPNDVHIRGEGRARSASPRLAWLDDAPLRWEARIRRDSNDFTATVSR